MARKQLEKFNPEKLKPGRSAHFTVVNPTTHYHECHYFYRDRDGELFTTITRNQNTGDAEKKEWLRLKRAKAGQFQQLALLTVPESPSQEQKGS